MVLAGPKGPLVKLDDKYYKLVDKMEALTEAPPSLLHADSLTVKGPVKFLAGTSIAGDVLITNGAPTLWRICMHACTNRHQLPASGLRQHARHPEILAADAEKACVGELLRAICAGSAPSMPAWRQGVQYDVLLPAGAAESTEPVDLPPQAYKGGVTDLTPAKVAAA